MNANDLLGELGQKMGLGKIEVSDENTCRLIFDDKLIVDFEPSNDGKQLYVYSVLCSVAHGERDGFYRRLLLANLFGRETGGASFGLDDETDEVIMFRSFPLETTDFQVFQEGLEAFLNGLEEWMERAGSGTLSDLSPEDGKDEGRPDPGMIRA